MSGIIGFEADIRNSKEFKKISKMRFKTRRAIRQSWFLLGKTMELQARKEMARKPKAGKTYYIRVRGRIIKHIASAPGETHANLTGRLRAATSFKVHGSSRMDFGYGFAIKKDPDYSLTVEEGSTKRKVAARPSIENAIKATKEKEASMFMSKLKIEFKRL
jgi:hypothetical protein